MTKLMDLNPRWVSAGGEGITKKDTGEPVPLRTRVGLSFDCPCGCSRRAFVLFENPIDGGQKFGDPAWTRTGDSFESITLSPSIQRKDGCQWHGFLIDGEFRSC